MSLEFTVKRKKVEIKFNFAFVYKVNKKLGTKDDDGKPQNDGVGALFINILERDDDAVKDIIELSCKDKVTEEESLEAIAKYIEDIGIEDEEEAYEKMFQDVQDAMVESGFFVKKAKKYTENLERAIKNLEAKEDEDSKLQVETMKELVRRMKSAISSQTAQETD